MNLTSPLSGLLRDSDAAILTALQRTVDGFTGRRLEVLTGATSRSAHRDALARLQTLGLVTRTDVGNAGVYTLNRRHVMWKPLERVLESPALLEEEIAKAVARRFPMATVAAFGSFARGDSSLESDLDVVIVADGGTARQRADLVDELTDHVRDRVGNALHVILLETPDLNGLVRAKDPLVESWLDDAHNIAGPELRSLIRTAAASR
jgi:predicted nucleotidyltransferase